jgi:ABC-2 type transport system ATP-binding protein
MSTVLRAVDLSKDFRGVPVLNGLNLEVPDGSVFGLIGPNGAGKTTTIKLLMNILKPTSGRAEILGVDSRRLSPEDLTRIGYVSENQEMPDWMTVEQFFAYLKPFYPGWDNARTEELVRQFQLPPARKLRHLSRGMWMKTALVSSLAYRPRLLVLDEPFSGLDPVMREDLIEGLLISASETAILISSHDLGDIESFVSHIGYLDRGRLQFSEEMTSLTERFRHIEVTLPLQPRVSPNIPWPSDWLRREATATLVRFVETHFDPEGTPNEIRAHFGEVREISVTAMPLRAIFLALARNGSKAA